MLEVILFTSAATAAITWCITMLRLGWRESVADWKIQTAQAIRAQADEMLAEYEPEVRYASAIFSPTQECQVIELTARERFVQSLRQFQERAVAHKAQPLDDWTPEEFHAIRGWWHKDRPTPLVMDNAYRAPGFTGRVSFELSSKVGAR